jgi:hypothetical protein
MLCGGKEKGGEWMCEQKISSYVCRRVLKKKGCVQELNMEGFPWQSLWSFVSNSCSSQIHRWICVKLKTIHFWKV